MALFLSKAIISHIIANLSCLQEVKMAEQQVVMIMDIKQQQQQQLATLQSPEYLRVPTTPGGGVRPKRTRANRKPAAASGITATAMAPGATMTTAAAAAAQSRMNAQPMPGSYMPTVSFRGWLTLVVVPVCVPSRLSISRSHICDEFSVALASLLKCTLKKSFMTVSCLLTILRDPQGLVEYLWFF
jgi:hypothetical protein